MIKTRPVKRPLSALATVALLLATFVVTVPPADAGEVKGGAPAARFAPPRPTQADLNDMACVVNIDVSFSTGLTMTPVPKTASVTTELAPCMSRRAPQITSGAYSARFQETTSCLTLLYPMPGETTIRWNTGEKSTFTFTLLLSHLGGNTVTTLNGAITGGKFAGAAAKGGYTYPSSGFLDCLTKPEGATSATGFGALVIDL